MKKLLENIRLEILNNLPIIQTCVSYPKAREKIIAPAVFLEIANYLPGTDAGTEQLSLIANLEARVVIDSLPENAEVHAQELAQKVAKIIHLNNFSCEITPAKISGISRDFFKPDFDPYICWLIEWSHEIHVGESIFAADNEGVPPHEIIIKENIV